MITKYDKKRESGEVFLYFLQPIFFFQANVLAAKEIIHGDNLFLLPTLRVDKLPRLLFDRNVSWVHSSLKSIHDLKFMVGQFALTDNFFQLFLYFHFFFCLDKKAFVSKQYQNALWQPQFSVQCMMGFLSASRNYYSIF